MTLPSGGPARAGLAAPGPAAPGACPRGLAGQEAALAGTAGADGAGPGLLELAGDEARLPAGSKLADERAAARRCFVILDGQASVERAGARCRDLGRGDFVGLIGADGGPLPPAGVTIRLETSARVLVIDPVRLAMLIGTDPAYAALQYFGTKGFFPEYLARAREPIDGATAREWLRLARVMHAGATIPGRTLCCFSPLRVEDTRRRSDCAAARSRAK